MRSYESLDVFQRADKLALEIYLITKKFPREELFGIVSQLRRSASSIPVNIVEGYTRNSTKEFLQFLNISKASAAETKYWVSFSGKIGYIIEPELASLLDQVEIIVKMMTKLIQSLNT
jgi:four helix bundle protein